jgi:beta-glucosidase
MPCATMPHALPQSRSEPEQRAEGPVGRVTLEEKVSQMQDVATAIWRLGVPAYNPWNDPLHSMAHNGFATNLPQSNGQATFSL